MYCTVLYCTVLYCTVLYCTVLYCTVLYRWGYEIAMVQLLASRHNFSIVYDPPADGLWGALEESGSMSGLIGRVSCKWSKNSLMI